MMYPAFRVAPHSEVQVATYRAVAGMLEECSARCWGAATETRAAGDAIRSAVAAVRFEVHDTMHYYAAGTPPDLELLRRSRCAR